MGSRLRPRGICRSELRRSTRPVGRLRSGRHRVARRDNARARNRPAPEARRLRAKRYGPLPTRKLRGGRARLGLRPRLESRRGGLCPRVLRQLGFAQLPTNEWPVSDDKLADIKIYFILAFIGGGERILN